MEVQLTLQGKTVCIQAPESPYKDNLADFSNLLVKALASLDLKLGQEGIEHNE